MNRTLLILIISLGVLGCAGNNDIDLNHYIRFQANGKSYELNYSDCYYINESTIKQYQNKTFISGYKSVTYKKNDKNELYGVTELPSFSVVIPSTATGSWTQADSILYAIEIDKGIVFSNLLYGRQNDSKFKICITESNEIGGDCIGTFSGEFTNEYGEQLKVENGSFKIKISK